MTETLTGSPREEDWVEAMRLLSHAQNWIERPPENASEEMEAGKWLQRTRLFCSNFTGLTFSAAAASSARTKEEA